MSGIIGQNIGRHTGLVKAASGGGGEWTKIKTLTASSSATLSFVNGASDVVLDSTYDEYCFRFNNIHPATTDANLLILGSLDGGSNYNLALNTTYTNNNANEGDSNVGLGYETGYDAHSATGGAQLTNNASTDNDACAAGSLYLFNPAGTTFTKNFLSNFESQNDAPASYHTLVGGYMNTTSAVNAVQFKFSSGNIDAGTISLYGIG